MSFCGGMTGLVLGGSHEADGQDDARTFAESIGASPEENATPQANAPADEGTAALLINPHSGGVRQTAQTNGFLTDAAKHVYATSPERGKTAVTVDVPACGFVVVRGGGHEEPKSSLTDKIRKAFGGKPKTIAEENTLRNEFMEVSVSGESGGISGVYSGATRGNRFSMRLVESRGGAATESRMVGSGLKITRNTPALGCIETTGELKSNDGGTADARFTLRYTLPRGSRVLRVDGEIIPAAARPQGESKGGRTEDNVGPWRDYFAARAAVASESCICRTLLRDRVHRGKTRRLVAPLGVVIDEAERQTLVAADGRAFHRRVDDRFLDTLLQVAGETETTFTLYYGFDLPHPVVDARALIAPPIEADGVDLVFGRTDRMDPSRRSERDSGQPASCGAT